MVTRLILPRGLDYQGDHHLEVGWQKKWLHKDNKSICTLYKKSTIESKGIIVLAHPYLAEAKQFYLRLGQADMYLAMDLDVVLFDFNGFGESPFINFDFQSDINIVTEYLKLNYPTKKIFGHGVSFGASHIITNSTHPNHHFTKIIVENCLDSNLTYYNKRNKKLYYLMKTLMFLLPNVNKHHNYVKAIGNLKNLEGLLLIYNKEDDLTTISMGNQLLENSSIAGEIVILNGKHLEAYPKNTIEYKKTISYFLIDC